MINNASCSLLKFGQTSKVIMSISLLILAGISAHLILKKTSKRNDSDFSVSIGEMITKGIKESLGSNLDGSVFKIENLSEVQKIRGIPEVVRIDLQIKKESPDSIIATVLILLKGDPSPKIGRIEGKFRWHKLPQQYRTDLITSNLKEQFYTLYDERIK